MKRKVRDSFEFKLGEGMGGLAAFNPDVLLAQFKPGDTVRVTVERIERKRTPKEKP